jgi:arylsulfatase
MRYENWKVVFLEQRSPGTMAVWFEPFTQLRGMKMFDLRADPYERADITSNTYYDWMIDRAYSIYGAQAIVAEFLATFKEFPPSQRAATFGVDQAMEKMREGIGRK